MARANSGNGGNVWQLPEETTNARVKNAAIAQVLLEIGLDGQRGITLPRLLCRLHACFSSLRQEDDEAIWHHILNRASTGIISLRYLPTDEHAAIRQQHRLLSSESMVDNPALAARSPSSWPPGFADPVPMEEVQTLAQAQAVQTEYPFVLVANESLYETCLQTFCFEASTLTLPQGALRVLEEVALWRHVGISGPELQSHLKISPRDFGHFSDSLVTWRLVSRYKRLRDRPQSGVVIEYRLHRYASFPTTHQVTMEDNELAFHAVCALEQKEGRSAQDSALRHELGLSTKKWRGVRSKLLDDKYVEYCDSIKKGSNSERNGLLTLKDSVGSKDWYQQWPQQRTHGPSDEEMESKARPTLTLMQQVFREIWNAGKNGIRTTDLNMRLMLQARVGKLILDALASQSDVALQKDHFGKQSVIRAFARNAPDEPENGEPFRRMYAADNPILLSVGPISTKELESLEEFRRRIILELLAKHGFLLKSMLKGAVNDHPERPKHSGQMDSRSLNKSLESLVTEGKVDRRTYTVRSNSKTQAADVYVYIPTDRNPPLQQQVQNLCSTYPVKKSTSGNYHERLETLRKKMKGPQPSRQLSEIEKKRLAHMTGWVSPRGQRLKVLHTQLFHFEEEQLYLSHDNIKQHMPLETYLKLFGYVDRAEGKGKTAPLLSDIQWDLLHRAEQVPTLEVQHLPEHLRARLWTTATDASLRDLLSSLCAMRLLHARNTDMGTLFEIPAEPMYVDTVLRPLNAENPSLTEMKYFINKRHGLEAFWTEMETVYGDRKLRGALLRHIPNPRPIAKSTESKWTMNGRSMNCEDDPDFKPKEWAASKNVGIQLHLRILRAVATRRSYSNIERACCLIQSSGEYSLLADDEVDSVAQEIGCHRESVIAVSHPGMFAQNSISRRAKRKRFSQQAASTKARKHKRTLDATSNTYGRMHGKILDSFDHENEDGDAADEENMSDEQVFEEKKQERVRSKDGVLSWQRASEPVSKVKQRHVSTTRQQPAASCASSSDASNWMPSEQDSDNVSDNETMDSEHDERGNQAELVDISGRPANSGQSATVEAHTMQQPPHLIGSEVQKLQDICSAPVPGDTYAPVHEDRMHLHSVRNPALDEGHAMSLHEQGGAEPYENTPGFQLQGCVEDKPTESSADTYQQIQSCAEQQAADQCNNAVGAESTHEVETDSEGPTPVCMDLAKETLKILIFCIPRNDAVPSGLAEAMRILGEQNISEAVKGLKRAGILQVNSTRRSAGRAFHLQTSISEQLKSFPSNTLDEFCTTVEELELNRDDVASSTCDEPGEGRMATIISAFATGQVDLSFRQDPSNTSYENIAVTPTSHFAWSSELLPEPSELNSGVDVQTANAYVLLAGGLVSGEPQLLSLTNCIFNTIAQEFDKEKAPSEHDVLSSLKSPRASRVHNTTEEMSNGFADSTRNGNGVVPYASRMTLTDLRIILEAMSASGILEKTTGQGSDCCFIIRKKTSADYGGLEDKLRQCMTIQMKEVARRLPVVYMLRHPDTSLSESTSCLKSIFTEDTIKEQLCCRHSEKSKPPLACEAFL